MASDKSATKVTAITADEFGERSAEYELADRTSPLRT
jgi:hypothetical protein